MLLITLASPAVLQSSARAEEGIKIGHSRIEGSLLYLYHKAFEREDGDQVKVIVRGEPCSLVNERVGVKKAGEDRLTTLFIIDRAGDLGKDFTPKTIGFHGPAIFGAVNSFIAKALEQDPDAKFAIIDALSTRGGGEAPFFGPSNSIKDISAWIQERVAIVPKLSRSDIYNRTNRGLTELNGKETTALRAAVMISDGRDDNKGEKKDPLNRPNALADTAKRLGIPVSAIHVGLKPVVADTETADKTKAAGVLLHVTEKTGGIYRTLPAIEKGKAKKSFQADLEGELEDIAKEFGTMVRTECELCGNNPNMDLVDVEISVTKDGKKLASNAGNRYQLELPNKNFGDCGVSDCSVEADCDNCRTCVDGACQLSTCESNLDCGSGCRCVDEVCKKGLTAKSCSDDNPCEGEDEACIDGRCRSACTTNEDCVGGDECDDGHCLKAAEEVDWLPIGLGGLVFLSILLIGLGIRQKKNAEANAKRAAENAARKREQEERDRQQASERDAMQRQLENERAEASAREAEASAREAELAQEVSAREAQLAAMEAAKEAFRLVTTEGTPAVDLRIPLGAVWSVGGDHDNAVVIDHDSVSGKHAQLSVDDEGRLWVSDLSSSNGTFVASGQTRGQAIRIESAQPTELCGGDQLWLSKSYCLAIEALK
jgi:hypothetical protein